jgi:hypothetical protein
LSDLEAAAYSSLGLAGATAFPAAYAPCDAGTMLRGLRVPGTISGTTSRIGGTSAAAPVFARWLVNWMGQNPSFTIRFDDVKTHFAAQLTHRPIGASPVAQPVIDDKYLLT